MSFYRCVYSIHFISFEMKNRSFFTVAKQKEPILKHLEMEQIHIFFKSSYFVIHLTIQLDLNLVILIVHSKVLLLKLIL